MRIIGGKHRGTKLYTLEGQDTRPTLDRVKESLFNILSPKLHDAIVLDLFAGSGALGLEATSRGAKKVFLCDNAKKAMHIIEQNVDKIKPKSEIQLLRLDYLKALAFLEKKHEKIDIIFLDPPYLTDFSQKACEQILAYDLLSPNGIIVIETDRKDEIIEDINKMNGFDIYDQRKYGRVELIFLKPKER